MKVSAPDGVKVCGMTRQLHAFLVMTSSLTKQLRASMVHVPATMQLQAMWLAGNVGSCDDLFTSYFAEARGLLRTTLN